jgi:menaquinol-cytochrome c reductase iron-sulfur subunit
MGPPEEKSALPRRNFLVNGIKAIAGLIGLGIGVPLAGFFISPVWKKDEHDWIEIADIRQVKAGQPTKVSYHYVRKDGWKSAETRRTAFVMKQADGDIAILTNRCTHLGCGVNWNSALKQFKCPCHGGIFDAQGNVVGGPPSKPLARLLVKIEAGKIFVKEA